MEQADVIIVGAGLLGCFAARALSFWDLRIVVLEQREDVCTGISKANTGIIYTGCDTKPGTLKTKLCTAANRSFDALCRELDVPFRRCGSLMLAFGPKGEAVLQNKLAQGRQNGVPGLRLLDRGEVLEAEPVIDPSVTAGLYAPGTGTVNPWDLGIAAFENARANGAAFRFCEKVEAITRREGGFLVETEHHSYRARVVVNCAGLRADAVRELVQEPEIRLFPTASDYLILDRAAGEQVRHVIFHQPEAGGKGLTLVPTVDGNLLAGPTERDPAGAPFATTREGLDELIALCRQVVPGLRLEQVMCSFASLRPNPRRVQLENGRWMPTGQSISSFSLCQEDGFFSLLGIKTPGLTCAAQLGEYTAHRVIAYLGDVGKNTGFSPSRRGILDAVCLKDSERQQLMKRDPAYGTIVCYCRNVSEGQIVEAIRRGAVTLDGVKRRTGAGMGPCQSGSCHTKILNILARELHCPADAVTKDGGSSYLVCSESVSWGRE